MARKTVKTKLIHLGRGETKPARPVNPPVMRASTILFKDHSTWSEFRKRRASERILTYGARGTETNFELENLVTELEGGYRAQLFPTGLSALATVILNYVRSGGHLLLTDGIYAPIRTLCDFYLKENDMQFDFVKADGSNFKEKIRPNTQLVLCESPGSVLYEIIDLPELSRIAHEHNIPVAIDNTYGSSYLFNPLQHGADISVVAATKYLCGHSDVVMGIVVCNESEWKNFGRIAEIFGLTASPDDVYLVLRGMRTLDLRIRAHEKSALIFAKWLQNRKEVETVFYPALENHPGHEIWKRDFKGSNGMVTIEMKKNISLDDTILFVDSCELFGIGASWGGYESLAIIVNPEQIRTETDWNERGPFVRFHVGLEDINDLITDIDQAFNKMKINRRF